MKRSNVVRFARAPARRYDRRCKTAGRMVSGVVAAGLVGVAAIFSGTGGLTAAAPGSAGVSTSPKDIVGRATVLDGDTIEIQGEKVRFNGIDAPESNQTCRNEVGRTYRCGAESARFLQGLLAASRPTRCSFVERDQYGRFVGNCHLADGRSVNAEMVRQGHAVDWPRHSGGAFAGEQRAARSARRGLWRGEFEMPWKFRADRRPEQPQQVVPLLQTGNRGACAIKGNISASGERIYHVPGQEHYSRTRISTSRGERWFCTEADARAAGWRRARK